jgi:hypothetical protein
MKLKQRRVCLSSGYKYLYDMSVPFASLPSPKSWRSSSDEHWDTVVDKAVCGKLVGHRRIDGARVTVVQAAGKLYAATHATRGLPPDRAKPGTSFVGARRRGR